MKLAVQHPRVQRCVNALLGCIGFAAVMVLSRTGAALRDQTAGRTIDRDDYLFIALVIASIFFLQYAVERYLLPPHLLPKAQRRDLLARAEAGYRKSFFRGAVGLSYFLLICYVFIYLSPADRLPASRPPRNPMAYSVSFLALGYLARARGIIFYLAQQKKAAQSQAARDSQLADERLT